MSVHARSLSFFDRNTGQSVLATLTNKKLCVMLGVISLLVLAQGAQAAVIEEFDTGLDGWSMLRRNGTLTWQDAGGNPDGYALYTDTRAGTGTIKAPAAFLGDLTDYKDGTLAYDYNVFDTGAGIRRFSALKVTLYSKGRHYTYTIPSMPSTSWESLGWQTFVIPMTSAAWHTTDANWDKLFANVTKMTIGMESTVNVKRPYDTDGIDNIVLTGLGEPPVPEPATLGVILMGALPLIIRRRRQMAAR